jgi:GNAT superfamily N-acetyltransferase
MSNHARKTVDRFISIRTGVSIADLKPEQVAVATCDRRTYAELGKGFVSLLWIVHLGDRAALSVHPSALGEVSRLAWGRSPDEVLEDAFVDQARAALATALPGVPLRVGDTGISFYHPGDAPALQTDGQVRVLTAADKGKWPGPRLYMSAAEHPCAERGEAFGVFLGDTCVAEVITHEPSVKEMAHLIAEDGIEVAEEYRGRGYGKAVFAGWTRYMQQRGRVCLHGTGLDNAASIALARSVGYVEYMRSRGIAYVPPEE